MRRAFAALLLLSACSGAPDLPQVTIPLRNPTAPVASQADATAARLAGEWVVVQGAGVAPGTRLRFSERAMSLDGVAMPMATRGAGRFELAGQTVWVHWLDADNRTAAMGDPAGARVWIMDRGGAPGERLHAAREILDWYGYDLRRLDGV
ncbi:lipocalin [Salipiger abyssi]|uniref:lipocalin n=1 Tax=Salipiger abyssi TaxID=1250539 RepID=UPI001A8F7CC6|nr:lipocalin [Salipiger abyssi]MBN9886584.1 lipocalin [Salipiger abyssi]